ncbi:RNA-binding protein YlmH, contains S4-like domain [Lachnospiraceae bacterium XBB1006]|nr:RNA-binding protein YlmH, contains S4-like domain [Lachnospiraceae bacterium XBB1006]
MTAEEKLFVKRLEEFDRKAQSNYYVCFTDFLNANEYSLFLECKRNFYCETQVYSGIEMLERQMVAFIPDALVFENQYPIRVLQISPKNPRFSGEMTHRDVLGTLMGLSLERKLIGDILGNENGFYVLVKDTIAPIVMDEIHRIRHTEVVVSEVELDAKAVKRSFVKKNGTVASMRLDCIVSEIAHISRSQALHMVSNGLVFVNARQTFHNATTCKEGDVLSLRKIGKFRICEMGQLSRKGKIKLVYEQYC